MSDVRLRSVRLVIADSAALVQFYRDGLGLTLEAGQESGGYARFVDGSGGTVELIPHDYPEAMASDVSGADNRAAMVFETGDLHEAVRTLREQGAGVITEPTDLTPLGVRIAQIRDPAGNLIVLHQKLA